MALRHFLDINSLSPAVLRNIVDAAHEMKRAGKKTKAAKAARLC